VIRRAVGFECKSRTPGIPQFRLQAAKRTGKSADLSPQIARFFLCLCCGVKRLSERLDSLGAGRGSPFGFGGETVTDALTDILNLFSDLAADFFATGGGKQHCRCDSHAYARREGQSVAERVVFATVEILRLVAEIGNAVSSAADGIGNAAAHVVGDVFGLV
jgi:hypothetical protein